MMLRWRTPDTHAATRRLRVLGFDVRQLAFDGVTIVLESAPGTPGDRLAVAGPECGGLARAEALPADDPPAADDEAPVRGDDDISHPNGLSRLVAVGWATVDLERAAAEFGRDVRELAPDRLLGARAGLLVGEPCVLLEPTTEGRLAATLARWGEGPAVLYLAGPGEPLLADTRPTVVGPFGPSALLAGPVWGPHLVVCSGTPVPSDTIGR